MSALVGKQYNLDNLIAFDENGLTIASFVDIKKTLIKRAKELYGADIDVSDASVDGQWITELALMFNSCLQAFNNLYADLDPAVAQGKALDLLASFSNIARKPAQQSVCNITLYTSIDKVNFKLSKYVKFIDKNGLTWSIDENRAASYLPGIVDEEYTLDFNDENQHEYVVPLICDVYGAISIPANTIENFVQIDNENADIMLKQEQAGIKGSIEESDAHLRARRNHSGANEAITVTDSIYGSLMDNVNIIDAYVINHYLPDPAGAPQAMQHSVETIVHRKYHSKNTATNDQLDDFIADTILNHLTPGIPGIYENATTKAYSSLMTIDDTIINAKNARKQKTYENTAFTEAVEWTEAIEIKPMIRVYLHSLQNIDKVAAATNVIKAIAKYVNELGLLNDIELSALLQTILRADPKYQGYATYYCTPNDIYIDDISDTDASSSTARPFTYLLSDDDGKTFASAKIRKTFYKYDDVVVIDSTISPTSSFGAQVKPQSASDMYDLIYDEYVNLNAQFVGETENYRLKDLLTNKYFYKYETNNPVEIKKTKPKKGVTSYDDDTLYIEAYATNSDASIAVMIY